jgi:hypothetical protein
MDDSDNDEGEDGGTYLLDGGARDTGACVFRMDGDAFLRDE